MQRAKKVLMVDADPLLSQAVAALLQSEGLELAGVEPSERAADAAAHLHPDLVIVNGYGLLCDGLDLVRLIRGSSDTRDTSFIYIASILNPERSRQCLQAGVNAVMFEPFLPEELVATVRRVLAEKASC